MPYNAGLQAAGIECLDCYCVDNLLARLGDPSFIGACYTAGAEVGAWDACRRRCGRGVVVDCMPPMIVHAYSIQDAASRICCD